MQRQNAKFSKLFLCVILTILLSVCFVACNGGVFDSGNDALLNSNTISPKATSYVCLDINPSIEMVLDQNDTVLSVASGNEDGLLMLWNEDGIVGANLQVAIKKITQLSLDYGYLCADNNVINISVSTIAQITEEENKDKDKNDDKDKGEANDGDSDNHVNITDNTQGFDAVEGEEDEDKVISPEELAKATIVENVKLAIESALNQANCDFEIVLENGVDIALLYELENLKHQHPFDENILNMDVETFRLVKRAMSNDGRLSFESALELGKEKLLSLVNDEQAKSTNKLGKAFEKAQSSAQFEYESQKQVLVDNLYSAYFINELNSAQNFGEAFDLIAKIGYATQYTMLRGVHISLVNYATYLHEFLSNPVYDEESVQCIFEGLKSHMANADYDEFIERVCDSDGHATLESINSYLNSLYRKCSADEREMFYTAYCDIKFGLDCLASVPEEKITAIANSVQNVVDETLSSLSIQLGDMLDTIKNCLPDIDYSDIESVKGAISAIDASMQRALSNMRLSTDDLARIAEMQADISDALDNLKTTLNEQITTAKATAIQTLDERKASLRASIEG